jgi:hypothetical protein
MLEFYPVHRAPLPLLTTLMSPSSYARSLGIGVALAALASGCATTPGIVPTDSRAAPTPANVEPPAPGVNLSGFPLPYRQGYADGCASAGGVERKDTTRFNVDGNYRTGWQDGLAICRRK